MPIQSARNNHSRQWCIWDFVKGGAKFLLATSAHTNRGLNHVFLIFSYGEKTKFVAKGDHGPMTPPKYATIGRDTEI